MEDTQERQKRPKHDSVQNMAPRGAGLGPKPSDPNDAPANYSSDDSLRKTKNLSFSTVDPAYVETLRMRERHSLSHSQKNEIEAEMLGRSSRAPVESPAITDLALQRFQMAIDKIASKDAYIQALDRGSLWVLDPAFRLRFLRAACFDSKVAASRFVVHLELLLRYFGAVALERPIRLEDVGKEGKKYLASGALTAMPYRDKSGRRIVSKVSGGYSGVLDTATVMKASLYIFTAVSEEEDTQRNGVVLICLPAKESNSISQMIRDIDPTAIMRLFEGLPVRFAAIHLWRSDDPLMSLVQSVYLLAFGKSGRLNTKIHTGSQLEVFNALEAEYGIQKQGLPLNADGNLKHSRDVERWIRTRKILEEGRIDRGKGDVDVESIVECPRNADIVFWQGGGGNWELPGNAYFRNLIQKRLPQYAVAATNEVKNAIVYKMIVELRQQNGGGGRFLQWTGRYFVEETNLEAIETKVLNALRNHKAKLMRQQSSRQGVRQKQNTPENSSQVHITKEVQQSGREEVGSSDPSPAETIRSQPAAISYARQTDVVDNGPQGDPRGRMETLLVPPHGRLICEGNILQDERYLPDWMLNVYDNYMAQRSERLGQHSSRQDYRKPQNTSTEVAPKEKRNLKRERDYYEQG